MWIVCIKTDMPEGL